MNLIPVESSNVKAIGHDPESNTLHVQFHSGDTWAYADVSPTEHAALMNSDRKGVHFHHIIRKNKKGTRMST